MLKLAFRNLARRPPRTLLTLSGLALSIAVLATLWSFGHGYERALGTELDRMGLQMMLVPLGCPYDAAARVLKGKTLDNSLPDSALAAARGDPAVAVAAPLLLAAVPAPGSGRTDMWVGLDETALELKPWWQAQAGSRWFDGENSVILGCDAAEVELRTPGDLFFSPESGREFRVAGVLERSGTSDDSLFFVPLGTAQRMFDQPGRLTAVAIRLRDPGLLREATARLQSIPGAQVVTLTEMMGTFLNLVGAVRTLMLAIGMVAVAVSLFSVFNTLLASVVERTGELAAMRAIGASRWQIVRLISLEAIMLSCVGSACGVLLALVAGPAVERLAKQFILLAPEQHLLLPTATILIRTLLLGALVGLASGLYPAWRASRLHPAEALKAE